MEIQVENRYLGSRNNEFYVFTGLVSKAKGMLSLRDNQPHPDN